MTVIASKNPIPGTYGPFLNAGAPGAGTNEVQRITIGGTPTGGTFKLTFDGFTTGDINWSSTNATLLANIEAALEALPNCNGVTVAAASLTAGIGTLDVTFDGTNVGKKAQPTMTYTNSLTGTAPTLAIAEQTAGVTADFRDAPKGALVIDTTNAKLYINTGSPQVPTWTVVGTQT